MSAGLFFSTIVNNAKQRAEVLRQQKQHAQDLEAQVFHDAMNNPNSTPEERQRNVDRLNKILDLKPDESPYSKVTPILNQVGGQLRAASGGQPVTADTPLNVPGSTHPNATETTPTAGMTGLDTGTAPKSLPPLISAPTDGGPPSASPPSPSFDSGAGSGASDSSQAATTSSATPSAAPSTNLTGSGSDTLHPASLTLLATKQPTFMQKVAHVAGRGLTMLGNGIGAAENALSPPASDLPQTTPIVAADLPAPPTGAIKWETNPVKRKDIEPTITSDRGGNPLGDDDSLYLRGTTASGQKVVQPFVPKPSIGRPMPIARVSASSAQARASRGESFPDMDTGKPIDVTKLKPNEMLVKVAGSKNGYTIGNQDAKSLNFDGIVHTVPSLEETAPDQYTSMGTQVAPTSTTTERVVGVDANNNPIIAPMTSTRHGVTTAPTGLPPLSPGAQMNSIHNPPTGNAPIPTSHTPASAPSSHLRSLPGVIPLGQANSLRQRNTALNGTTTALENAIKPDSDSGKSYLDLFKPENSKERSKVADFIRLNDSIAEGDYSNRAGEGDISSILSFSTGLPSMVASAKNSALTSSYEALKKDPAAMKAVADYYNLIGQIGGMRKATGANASQWAFSNLKQEVPSPLIDSSYEGVLNKMHNLANEVNSNAQPNLQARPFDMNLLQPKSTSQPATKSLPRVSPPKTADDYLQSIGLSR